VRTSNAKKLIADGARPVWARLDFVFQRVLFNPTIGLIRYTFDRWQGYLYTKITFIVASKL